MPTLAQRLVLFGGQSYTQKVAAIAPASLIDWSKMAEASGAVAVDSSQLSSNGAYANVTLAQPGIGDGLTAALFNGTTSKNNRYTAARAAAFNPAELTTAFWFKPDAWLTAGRYYPARFCADVINNIFNVFKNTNGTLVAEYIAGGTYKAVTSAVQTSTDWMHVCATASKSGDVLRLYINGVSVGTPATGLGTWVGALDPTLCLFGASDTGPSSVMAGPMQHGLLWTTALSAAQALALATV